MRLFSTEFPVQRISDRAEFIAQIIGWLRGADYSSVFDTSSSRELDDDYSILKSDKGEELIFREISESGNFSAIGFRHDYRDEGDRLWRTEAVLRRTSGKEAEDLIRLRTLCLPLRPDAQLDTPKKPYLIKAILQDNLGGIDKKIYVSDRPIFLEENSDCFDLARNVILGGATKYLPVVYVSCCNNHRWLLSDQEIEKLSYDLGGIAHVLVEPTIDFSFRIKHATDGENVYGGTVGLFVPGQGFCKQFYLGWEYPNLGELRRGIVASAIRARSYLPAAGWDWTELQEEALARQRARERSRLQFDEKEQIYNEEIDNLKERNKELQDRITSLEKELSNNNSTIRSGSDSRISYILSNLLGPEIYDGEFVDRLKLCVEIAGKCADREGLDPRSIAFIEEFMKRIQSSKALKEFRSELDNATNSAKRLASDVGNLMTRHGFFVKSENKHTKLEPIHGYWGLSPIILAKTPSDARGLKNQRSQIEGALGIVRLK